MNISGEIECFLQFPVDINNCVSPMNQLLTCLRVYSIDGHLDTIADFMCMHTSTVSRRVVKVTQAIAQLYNRYTVMPNEADQIRQIQRNFFNSAGFPRVIGSIDCTHCRIISPGIHVNTCFFNVRNFYVFHR